MLSNGSISGLTTNRIVVLWYWSYLPGGYELGMIRQQNYRNPRNGQVALMMALTLPVTLGLIGLVVDVGWAYWRQEACRTAAQAAAYASAMAAYKSSNLTCASGVTCAATFTQCPSTPTSPPTTKDRKSVV